MIFARKVASEADDGFLFQVYASTREQEIAEWGWTKQQQEEFLQMQYTCQKRSYESNYPHMEWYVIVHRQEPIGRLLINKQHDYWTLADMTILPVYQGRGYGSQLLQELLESANQAGANIGLHVATTNQRARYLYKKHGFQEIDHSGIYVQMEWKTSQKSSIQEKS